MHRRAPIRRAESGMQASFLIQEGVLLLTPEARRHTKAQVRVDRGRSTFLDRSLTGANPRASTE